MLFVLSGINIIVEKIIMSLINYYVKELENSVCEKISTNRQHHKLYRKVKNIFVNNDKFSVSTRKNIDKIFENIDKRFSKIDNGFVDETTLLVKDN